MEFKKYFKGPFSSDGIYIWTSNNNMALMTLNDDELRLDLFCAILNNESDMVYPDAYYKDEIIYINGQPVLLVRGWGYLTSPSCCNLDNDKACQIQDEFGEYVAHKLRNNK